MKLKANISTEKEFDIELPLIKTATEYGMTDIYAVLNENFIVKIVISEGYSNISHKEVTENDRKDIYKALTWGTAMTEEEFLNTHAAALASLSLEPKLVNIDDIKSVNI